MEKQFIKVFIAVFLVVCFFATGAIAQTANGLGIAVGTTNEVRDSQARDSEVLKKTEVILQESGEIIQPENAAKHPGVTAIQLTEEEMKVIGIKKATDANPDGTVGTNDTNKKPKDKVSPTNYE